MILRKLALVAGALILCAPAKAAPQVACADPCEIIASTVGYVLPVTEITSGTTVEWYADSETHPTTNSLQRDACFIVRVGGQRKGPVRFDIEDDGVYATPYPGSGSSEEVTRRCANARPLNDGSFTMDYQCLVHPWMRAALILRSSA